MNKVEHVLESKKITRDDTAEYMAELLMDTDVSTWKMFEELAIDYLNGTEEFRKGMDAATATLTGWYIPTIAEQLIDKYE